MEVVIIEDEPLAAQHLEKLMGEVDADMRVSVKLGSVRQSVQWLQQHTPPSLIFMDIQLGDGISFEIFEQVDVSCPVIFITAYDEYALKAFKVNSIDYILKPIDRAELQAAIDKFKRMNRTGPQSQMMESISIAMGMLTKKYKSRFVIKVGEHLRSVETVDILFLFSLEKATFAQTRDGRKHIVDYSMDQLEGVLDPTRFFRISRRYIVASDSIQDMISFTNSRLRLVLRTSEDQEIIVARERVQDFKAWLDR